MTQRPQPGSAWARHCPDAWPREWLDERRELPVGFARPADPREADLITGRISERAFLDARAPVRAPAPRRIPQRKVSPVVQKLLGYRRFLDALAGLEPRLSPGAVALWCWLWTCEGNGEARCSARKLGARFRVAPSTATRWLQELTRAGLVTVTRPGRRGQSATVVRVQPTAPRRRSASVSPVQHEHSSTK